LILFITNSVLGYLQLSEEKFQLLPTKSGASLPLSSCKRRVQSPFVR